MEYERTRRIFLSIVSEVRNMHKIAEKDDSGGERKKAFGVVRNRVRRCRKERARLVLATCKSGKVVKVPPAYIKKFEREFDKSGHLST
jgi:hypothetical protein